jgi:hypothetical protein
MSNEPIKPTAALDALRAALTELRSLAAVSCADPFYAQAAEQVASIVAEFEKRAGLDHVPPDPGFGLPHPPSPG